MRHSSVISVDHGYREFNNLTRNLIKVNGLIKLILDLFSDTILPDYWQKLNSLQHETAK